MNSMFLSAEAFNARKKLIATCSANMTILKKSAVETSRDDKNGRE
jgi:hypothetical protein